MKGREVMMMRCALRGKRVVVCAVVMSGLSWQLLALLGSGGLVVLIVLIFPSDVRLPRLLATLRDAFNDSFRLQGSLWWTYLFSISSLVCVGYFGGFLALFFRVDIVCLVGVVVTWVIMLMIKRGQVIKPSTSFPCLLVCPFSFITSTLTFPISISP